MFSLNFIAYYATFTFGMLAGLILFSLLNAAKSDDDDEE